MPVSGDQKSCASGKTGADGARRKNNVARLPLLARDFESMVNKSRMFPYCRS
jgi:hypothetical protein